MDVGPPLRGQITQDSTQVILGDCNLTEVQPQAPVCTLVHECVHHYLSVYIGTYMQTVIQMK